MSISGLPKLASVQKHRSHAPRGSTRLISANGKKRGCLGRKKQVASKTPSRTRRHRCCQTERSLKLGRPPIPQTSPTLALKFANAPTLSAKVSGWHDLSRMVTSTTAAASLRRTRTELAISQSRLARLSGVSRFKICSFEIGDGSLTPEQQNRLQEALRAEADRIRRISVQVDSCQSTGASAQELSR